MIDIMITSTPTKGGQSQSKGSRKKAIKHEEMYNNKKQLLTIPKKTTGKVRIEVDKNKQ